jgi:hypothetical protein
MKTFTLSLISTETANIKLITHSPEDAKALIIEPEFFDAWGDFESLDYQFTINSGEVNTFDRFSGATYAPVDGELVFDVKNKIEYILTSSEKTGVVREAIIPNATVDFDQDMLDMTESLDDYDESSASAMYGEDTFGMSSYNPDDL